MTDSLIALLLLGFLAPLALLVIAPCWRGPWRLWSAG